MFVTGFFGLHKGTGTGEMSYCFLTYSGVSDTKSDAGREGSVDFPTSIHSMHPMDQAGTPPAMFRELTKRVYSIFYFSINRVKCFKRKIT
jgi:hypothetical protein